MAAAEMTKCVAKRYMKVKRKRAVLGQRVEPGGIGRGIHLRRELRRSGVAGIAGNRTAVTVDEICDHGIFLAKRRAFALIDVKGSTQAVS
jgi:hypothetical protein